MVADTIRRGSSANGLQPLRLARDWRQVIALIELAFGEALDADARRALRSMRLPPLLAPLIGLLDSFSLPGEGMMPGFVWLEDGRVVGTASVRRVQPFYHGWLISNVAVHPNRQGRGIGRALLEAAVDYAEDCGGTWTVLQVRDSNLIARRLYESLGFQAIGEVVRLRRAEAGERAVAPFGRALRPARWSDGSALSHLARTMTPREMLWADVWNRALFRTGLMSRTSDWLKKCRRRWWVSEESGPRTARQGTGAHWVDSRLSAAVGIEVDARNPWHRLRLLISPQARDEARAARLIAFGLAQLADAPALPIEMEHPAADEPAQSALAEAGFERVYALIHMRLNL